MPTDEELMLAVGKGDLQAFEGIVLRHQNSAWNIACRFLGDETGAEDVTQQAFLKILAAAPRYRPTATFRTYLYRVVTNLCLDRVRKKQPAYSRELPITEDPGSSPVEVLLARERDMAVREALGNLPARQCIAVILRHYEGLSLGEIASAMSASSKAIERLLARARTSLQGILSDFLKK